MIVLFYMLILFWEFHMIHFDHILSSPPSSLRFSPPLYPPNFILCLSLKSNTHIHTTTTTTSRGVKLSNLCWPTIWLIYSVLLHWGKRKPSWFFPLHQVSLANGFLTRGATLCPLPLLCARILSVLILVRSSVCCYNICEFICASAFWVWEMLSLKVIHNLCLARSSSLLFCIGPWAFSKGLWY